MIRAEREPYRRRILELAPVQNETNTPMNAAVQTETRKTHDAINRPMVMGIGRTLPLRSRTNRL